MNNTKRFLYLRILKEIDRYKTSICKDYIFGKIMGMLEFSAVSHIISYESRFAIENYVDRKIKYIDRGGIV